MPSKRISLAQMLTEADAGEEAKRMGLDYLSFGRYGKDGKVTHKSQDGKLVPIDPKVDSEDEEDYEDYARNRYISTDDEGDARYEEPAQGQSLKNTARNAPPNGIKASPSQGQPPTDFGFEDDPEDKLNSPETLTKIIQWATDRLSKISNPTGGDRTDRDARKWGSDPMDMGTSKLASDPNDPFSPYGEPETSHSSRGKPLPTGNDPEEDAYYNSQYNPDETDSYHFRPDESVNLSKMLKIESAKSSKKKK